MCFKIYPEYPRPDATTAYKVVMVKGRGASKTLHPVYYNANGRRQYKLGTVAVRSRGPTSDRPYLRAQHGVYVFLDRAKAESFRREHSDIETRNWRAETMLCTVEPRDWLHSGSDSRATYHKVLPVRLLRRQSGRL